MLSKHAASENKTNENPAIDNSINVQKKYKHQPEETNTIN